MALRAPEFSDYDQSSERDSWIERAIMAEHAHRDRVKDLEKNMRSKRDRASCLREGVDETQLARAKKSMTVFQRIDQYLYGRAPVRPTEEEFTRARVLDITADKFGNAAEVEKVLCEAALALIVGGIDEIARGPISEELRSKIASNS